MKQLFTKILLVLSCMLMITTSVSANALSGTLPTVLAQLQRNHKLDISIGNLNNIQFPFDDITVDTVSDIVMSTRGSSLLVVPNSQAPVTLIVRDKNAPENYLTFTLFPKFIPSSSYQVVIPELLIPQTLLRREDLTHAQYAEAISRLIRSSAQLIGSAKSVNAKLRVSKAKVPTYSLKNFKFGSQKLTSESLELTEIGNNSLPVPITATCRASFNIKGTRTFQPTNPFFSGLIVRAIQITNAKDHPLSYEELTCSQSSVMASTLIGTPKLLPGEKRWVIAVEQLLN